MHQNTLCSIPTQHDQCIAAPELPDCIVPFAQPALRFAAPKEAGIVSPAVQLLPHSIVLHIKSAAYATALYSAKLHGVLTACGQYLLERLLNYDGCVTP